MKEHACSGELPSPRRKRLKMNMHDSLRAMKTKQAKKKKVLLVLKNASTVSLRSINRTVEKKL